MNVYFEIEMDKYKTAKVLNGGGGGIDVNNIQKIELYNPKIIFTGGFSGIEAGKCGTYLRYELEKSSSLIMNAVKKIQLNDYTSKIKGITSSSNDDDESSTTKMLISKPEEIIIKKEEDPPPAAAATVVVINELKTVNNPIQKQNSMTLIDEVKKTVKKKSDIYNNSHSAASSVNSK